MELLFHANSAPITMIRLIETKETKIMNISTCFLKLVRRVRCNEVSGLPRVFSLSFIHRAPRFDAEKTNENYLGNTSAEKGRLQNETPVCSIRRGQIYLT